MFHGSNRTTNDRTRHVNVETHGGVKSQHLTAESATFKTAVSDSLTINTSFIVTAIGVGASTTGTSNSTAIGNGVVTREDNEFATQDLRMIRLTALTSGNVASAPVSVFTLLNDAEVVSVDCAVTAMRTNSVTIGSEAVTWQFSNYLLRRQAGLGTVLAVGTQLTNDPSALGYTVALAASGNDLTLSVTGAAAESVSWVAVFRVWCAPFA